MVDNWRPFLSLLQVAACKFGIEGCLGGRVFSNTASLRSIPHVDRCFTVMWPALRTDEACYVWSSEDQGRLAVRELCKSSQLGAKDGQYDYRNLRGVQFFSAKSDMVDEIRASNKDIPFLGGSHDREYESDIEEHEEHGEAVDCRHSDDNEEVSTIQHEDEYNFSEEDYEPLPPYSDSWYLAVSYTHLTLPTKRIV